MQCYIVMNVGHAVFKLESILIPVAPAVTMTFISVPEERQKIKNPMKGKEWFLKALDTNDFHALDKSRIQVSQHFLKCSDFIKQKSKIKAENL